MANENVKITILEKDNTKPGGAGIAPSDIAFVPGFSVLDTAPKNIPTLCEDYLQFEKLFGQVPRVLTTRDIKGVLDPDKNSTYDYSVYGFLPGSFDASYIYAKELLLQGMPVIYSNIVTETDTNPLAVDLDVKTIKVPVCASDSYDFSKASSDIVVTNVKDTTGSILLRHTKQLSDTFTVRCPLKVTVPGIKVTQDGETTIYGTPNIKTLDVHADIDSVKYGEVTLDKIVVSVPSTSLNNLKAISKVEYLSDTQVEFTNTSEKPELFDVTIDVTFTLDCSDTRVSTDNANEFVLNIFEIDGSALHVFYNDTCNSNGHVGCIKEQLNLVKDKSVYSVKYITSGGYPSVVSKDGKTATTPFATEMLAAAEFRGDAVALIDYQRAEDEVPFDVNPASGSFYAKMQQEFNGISNGEYGATFYPWGEYSCGASLSNVKNLDSNDVYMPNSFSYMMCVAKAIKTSPNWLAMAGVSRGIVPKLNKICTPNNVLSNTIAEEMQPKFGVEGHNLSVNCITNIRPYGLTLWGNRTMKAVSKEGAVALNFLNTRNMLSDIKKVLYSTAKSLMFEQNSDTLWLRFKSGISPLLNQLKSGQGIADYKIVKGTTKYNGDPLQKGEMAAVVKIYPLYAVEYFELTVEINDQDVVVS